MTTLIGAQYENKAALPLDLKVSCYELLLYYKGKRKRKIERKSFTGLTQGEAIAEAVKYRAFYDGKFVASDNPSSLYPFGIWTTCEITRTEREGKTFFWTSRLIYGRSGVAVEEGQFFLTNVGE